MTNGQKTLWSGNGHRKAGSPGSEDPAARRSRGFTFVEILIVFVIIGLAFAVSLPNLQRARTRGRMLGKVKLVRQVVTLARINAIRRHDQVIMFLASDVDAGGGNTVDEFRLGVDEDQDGSLTNEPIINRWAIDDWWFAEGDSGNPPRSVDVDGVDCPGLVVRPGGMVLADSGNSGTGSGAFVITDVNENEIRITINSGSGSMREEMKDLDDAWCSDMIHWRY